MHQGIDGRAVGRTDSWTDGMRESTLTQSKRGARGETVRAWEAQKQQSIAEPHHVNRGANSDGLRVQKVAIKGPVHVSTARVKTQRKTNYAWQAEERAKQNKIKSKRQKKIKTNKQRGTKRRTSRDTADATKHRRVAATRAVHTVRTSARGDFRRRMPGPSCRNGWALKFRRSKRAPSHRELSSSSRS